MRFDGLCGNTALKQRLHTAFASGRVSHCWLLCGPEGSGRHTLARLMAAAMQCTSGGEVPCGHCTACRKVFSGQHPDVITVEDTEHVAVAVKLVRRACADVFERPNEGKRKIYFFPQTLDARGQNTLLKVLEEPPAYAAFILLCDAPEAMLPTVRSRSVTLMLSPVPKQEALPWLKSRFPSLPEQSLLAAYDRADGYLGQAAAILQAEPTDPMTAAFAECCASGDRLRLLELLYPMEKYKRDKLAPILAGWRMLLTQALAVKSGAPAASGAASVLAAGQTAAKLLQAAQSMQYAMDALASNASVGAVVGWLTTKLP